MKTFKLYILLAALTTGTLCFSQSKSKADILYENRAYVEAAEIFSKLPKSQNSRYLKLQMRNYEFKSPLCSYCQACNLTSGDNMCLAT